MRRAVGKRSRIQERLLWIVFLGGAGSVLIAVASDLPGSRFGAELGAAWPFAAGGAAPSWEGPVVPRWADPANNLLGPGRLLPLGLAVLGVGLLSVSWIGLLRRSRSGRVARGRGVPITVAWWVVPLMFAAPFASQDVWTYGAEGKAVLSGLTAGSPIVRLGHSVWLAGVDPGPALRPSMYGPGALDLSALFVRVSGGRPWVSVECWRIVSVLALVVCGWWIRRCVSSAGGDAAAAVLWGVANPGVLIMVVASIHNDAVMMALVAAGMALATSGRPLLALVPCAAALSVKAPAALALLGVAWLGGRTDARGRILALLTAAGAAGAVLFVAGLPVGGGFAWLHSAAPTRVTSAFSVVGLAGTTSASVAGAVQVAGLGFGALLVILYRSPEHWQRALALGVGVVAVFAATAQPWYLLWPVVLIAADGIELESDRLVASYVVVMMACAELPLGARIWAFALAGLLLSIIASKFAEHVPGLARLGVRSRLGPRASKLALPERTASDVPGKCLATPSVADAVGRTLSS